MRRARGVHTVPDPTTMKGWFDAFRTDGGPTLYSYSNRTPATDDVSSIFVYLVFATLFVAFVIIFPGIRKERFTTFLSVTLSLFIGLVILLSIYGSDWHVARTTTATSYKSFSREKIIANIGVHIGLNSVNVSLKAPININQTSHIQYNERFDWLEATQIKEGYREALKKGLPFPILTVVEYLSLDGEGFSWGGRYRIAGYFSGILLWASFAIWLLMNILFCVVPRYGAYMMILTGLLLFVTNIVYYANLPINPMVIPFETGTLRFSFGWCYWLVLATGFICVLVGSVIAVIDVIFPHKFSTILEVDYDTPYDRHIILKKEKCCRKQQQQLKKNGGNGSGPSIEMDSRNLYQEQPQRTVLDESTHAKDNLAFEGDDSKMPWHLTSFDHDPTLRSVQSMRNPRSRTSSLVNSRDQGRFNRRSSGVVNIPLQNASVWR